MELNMKSKSSTSPNTSVVTFKEENQTIHPDQKEKELRDRFLSLSRKIEEVAHLNQRIFQMVESAEKKEYDSGVDIRGSSLKTLPQVPLTDPLLIYRLSYLMDFLKPSLGFHNWGVFLLTKKNSDPQETDWDIKKVASSSGSNDDGTYDYFEEEVKAQFQLSNVASAIAEKRRIVLPANEGNLLIIPFTILSNQDGFWAAKFNPAGNRTDEAIREDRKYSADLLFWGELVAELIENSYRSVASSGGKEIRQIEKEKLYSVVALSRAMVHEINNSLQIILGRTQILRMGLNKSPEAISNLSSWDTIEGNTNRICSILKNFSDFLHRQSDGLADVKEVNFQHILESNLVLLKYILGSAGIELELKSDDELPAICGDPAELELAFLTLIWGIKDSLPSGGSIRLETFQENESIDLKACWAEKRSENDKHTNLLSFENSVQFQFVSWLLAKNGGELQLEEMVDGKKALAMRFPMA